MLSQQPLINTALPAFPLGLLTDTPRLEAAEKGIYFLLQGQRDNLAQFFRKGGSVLIGLFGRGPSEHSQQTRQITQDVPDTQDRALKDS